MRVCTQVHVWNAGTGQLQQKMTTPGPVIDLCPALVNDQSYLVALTERQITVSRWNAHSWDNLFTHVIDTSIGTDFSFSLGQRTNSLPPLTSSSLPFSPHLLYPLFLPPLPFPPPLSPPLPLEVGPKIQLGGLGERCELPSGVRGEAPANKWFGAYWSQKEVSRYRSYSRFTHWRLLIMTSINNYSEFTVKQRKVVAGSNASHGGALWVVFLLGQSPPLPCGSRRLWIHHHHVIDNINHVTVSDAAVKVCSKRQVDWLRWLLLEFLSVIWFDTFYLGLTCS